MASLMTSFAALFLTGTAAAAGGPPWVSLTDLLNSPVTYLGHEIAVPGKVDDAYNSHIFTVEEVGIVQPFVRGELASEFNLTIDGAGLVAPLADRVTPSIQVEQSASSGSSLHSVTEITSSGNPAALIGPRVSMTGVTVQHIAGERSFWIAGGGATRTFVVVDGVSVANVAGRELTPGDVISVNGVIEAVPGSNRRVVVESWGRLDEGDAAALEHETVYIYAKGIRVERASPR